MKITSALSLALAMTITLISAPTADAQALPTCAQPGEGAALLEGECVFITGGYQRQNFDRNANVVASDTDQFSAEIGGQTKIADNWFVSVNAGYADFDAPLSQSGLERETERYSLGAAIKYVEIDLLLSASLGAAFDDTDQTGAAEFANTPGQGTFFRSEEKTYTAVFTLRAATLFNDGNRYYAKPSLDIGAIYRLTDIRRSATTGGTLKDSDHIFAFVTPAVEVGLDLDYDELSLRPFVFGGARFLLNEDETRSINTVFQNLQLADDELRFERTAATAFLGAGATLFASSGISSRMIYTASFQKRLVTHNFSARLQIDF